MRINFKKHMIEIPDVKECNWFNKIKGLMFSRREKAEALLFSFNEPTKMAIHSFLVFFPFIAVWLDNQNKVIEIRKIKPFVPRILCSKPYNKLLEIPINRKYREIVKSFITDGFPKKFKKKNDLFFIL